MSSKGRPEFISAPDLYYNEEESRKYAFNSRILKIQTEMSERAIELLDLPEDQPSVILDIGSGSGLSGDVIQENGHHHVGVDISKYMLQIAKERGSDGDLILRDMGTGMPFRPASFDGAISISALQWLCNANTKAQDPIKRIQLFFTTLGQVLVPGARAVFQFYPANEDQTRLLMREAIRCALACTLLVDNQQSKKKRKYFLIVVAGAPGTKITVTPKTSEYSSDKEPIAIYHKIGKKINIKKTRPSVKSRQWILKKKARQRRQGRDVRPDTKYTGRKRRSRW